MGSGQPLSTAKTAKFPTVKTNYLSFCRLPTSNYNPKSHNNDRCQPISRYWQPPPQLDPIWVCAPQAVPKIKYNYIVMDIIPSTVGKLLYFANLMCLQRQISQRDRGVLKDLIMAGSREVLRVYEQYQREGTELTLASDLIVLLRTEKENETEEASSQGSGCVRCRRSISISIPVRNIQKLPADINRI